MANMKAILGLIGLALVSGGLGQSVFGDETRAWMVGPAKAVSSGMVTWFTYSPTGGTILYKYLDPAAMFTPDSTTEPKQKWFVYDCQRGTSVQLALPETGQSLDVVILGNDRTAFFWDNRTPAIQGFIDLVTGQKIQTALPVDKLFYLGQNPACPFLMFQGPNGTLGVAEPGKGVSTYSMKSVPNVNSPTYSDSRVIRFTGFELNPKPVRFFETTLERTSGAATTKEITEEQYRKVVTENSVSLFTMDSDESGLRIGLPPLAPIAKGAAPRPKPRPSVLERTTYLCPEKFGPQLSPSFATVAYVDNGALLLRDIKPFDHDLAEKMKIAALKTAAMSQAKMVGMALIMYSADMDDVLPNGENFVNKLMPYLKDRKALDGFNYTFAGGPWTSIKDPVSTELGFVLGPGGKAVVYADGHAKWVNDKL